MNESPESPPREADRLIYAGLLGLAAASIVQMLDKEDVDTPQIVAVYAFALAIPVLAVGLITDYARRAGASLPFWRDFIGILGAVSAVIGLGALFFHFGTGIGTVFAGGCLLGVVLVRTL
jgi:hypothetical protein